ncbi:MAG: glycoside hydrolase, partial [Sphingobacteriaceae bacterium]
MKSSRIKRITFILLFFPVILFSQQVKIVTNHIGYENIGAKRSIVVSESKSALSDFQLVDANTGKVVFSGKPIFNGKVEQWKNWIFYTIDFTSFVTEGSYRLQVNTDGKPVSSYPFTIEKNVLEKATLSDVIYYFKGQRSSGLLDKADHHLKIAGNDTVIDAHGGWYDATGDYGKHLSHLSFSSYFNPQQIPLTAWSLFKSCELLSKKSGTDFRQFNRRLLDEAMYGADYLVRMKVKNGSFYRSVASPGLGKLPEDRVIQAEEKSYRIKASKDQAFNNNRSSTDWRKYQVSYRSGGGIAIAALALASGYPVSGDFSQADYLKAAENAFAFLEKNNPAMTNDGKENVIDDYCALSAATELYKVTLKTVYQQAAEKRAKQLLKRLISAGKYKNYWRADDGDRPFFHPSDAGFPLVSLLYYYPLASETMKAEIKKAVKLSMEYELSVTREVNNPFGYSRQLVQDTLGKRHTSFFFPHGSDASPWWQGENARLSSMATAARMAAKLFVDDRTFHAELENFST